LGVGLGGAAQKVDRRGVEAVSGFEALGHGRSLALLIIILTEGVARD